MQRQLTRWVVTGFLMSLVVAFATSVSAADWKKGKSYVDSVDLGAATITLSEETFHVPASCRIHDESGVRVSLSDLGVAIRPGELVPMDEVDFVEYEAVERNRRWEMVEITVMKRAPQ